MEIYPDVLPIFLAKNYSYSQNNTILRTEFATGRVRQSRILSDVPVYYQATTQLTDSELRVFEAWKYHLLKEVDWFEALIRTSAGCTTKTVRFTNSDISKKLIRTNKKWELSFILEEEKQDYMSESELLIALSAGADYGEQAMNVMSLYYTQYGVNDE